MMKMKGRVTVEKEMRGEKRASVMLQTKEHKARKGSRVRKGREVKLEAGGDMTTLFTMAGIIFCIFTACFAPCFLIHNNHSSFIFSPLSRRQEPRNNSQEADY